jgi:hypothetical protein
MLENIKERLEALYPQNIAYGINYKTGDRMMHPFDEYRIIVAHVVGRQQAGEPKEWTEGDLRAVTEEYSNHSPI